MATPPSTAVLSGSPAWSNGTPFDGWVRLGLVLPTNSDGSWPSAIFGAQTTAQRLPIWIEVPINAGTFNQQTKIWYNSSIDPPNTQYVAYWYDGNNRRLFPATGDSPTPFVVNQFTVTGGTYTISIPMLTVPSVGTGVIDPPTDVPVVNPSVLFSDAETLTGTLNGVNITFTVANTPRPASSLLLTRNGTLLKASIDYAIDGNVIVFADLQTPQVGDILQAWYRY